MTTRTAEVSLDVDKKGTRQTFPRIFETSDPESFSLCSASEYYWLIVLSCTMLGIFAPHIYKGTSATGHTFHALQKGMYIPLDKSIYSQILGLGRLETGDSTYLVTHSTDPKLVGYILNPENNILYGRKMGDCSGIQNRKDRGEKVFKLIEPALQASRILPPDDNYISPILYSLLEKTHQKLSSVQAFT